MCFRINYCDIFEKLPIFLQKYLVMSKKSNTFALAFEKEHTRWL